MIKDIKYFLIASIGLFMLQPALAQNFSGKTQLKTLSISSVVSSTVQEIKVEVGQLVKKGDPLIQMDADSLQLDYNIAKAELEAIAPDKELANMDLNRAFELYDRTLLSDVALKNAEFKFAQVKAKYDAAKAKKDKAEFFLNAAEIKSPIDGRVIAIHKTVGFFSDMDNAPALVTLADTSELTAVAYLKVSQWNHNLVGKKANISLMKKNYEGYVSSLGFTPVENAKGLSVYPVYIRFYPQKVIPAGVPLTINIK